jgi:hypothetical protein
MCILLVMQYIIQYIYQRLLLYMSVIVLIRTLDVKPIWPNKWVRFLEHLF